MQFNVCTESNFIESIVSDLAQSLMSGEPVIFIGKVSVEETTIHLVSTYASLYERWSRQVWNFMSCNFLYLKKLLFLFRCFDHLQSRSLQKLLSLFSWIKSD